MFLKCNLQYKMNANGMFQCTLNGQYFGVSENKLFGQTIRLVFKSVTN